MLTWAEAAEVHAAAEKYECVQQRGGASPDTGEQLSASGGSLCPELAELSRPAASDPREPGP